MTTLPDEVAALRGGVLLVEAERGRARAEALDAWTGRLRARGQDALLLPCDFRDGGSWAGVDRWVSGLLPAIERQAPGLLRKHALELSVVLPRRGGAGAAARTLTDLARGHESVRNYALDRAYRLPHGIIDLLDAWYELAPPPRVAVCEAYDRGGALARRFFRELLRRRGGRLGITLVLAVSPASADAVLAELSPEIPVERVRLDVPGDPPGRSPESAALARRLEEMAAAGRPIPESRLPALLRYWEEGGEPEVALPWMAYAIARFNHHGFYEDALLYVDPVLEGIAAVARPGSRLGRWDVAAALFNCLVAVGQVDRAYRVMREEAYDRIADPVDHARACYMMAMLHVRFLPQKDLEAAERYLREGLDELDGADPANEHREFLRIFLGNGLALVRSRQGKPREAIGICEDGVRRIGAGLGGLEHRLHRSVLLYNIAQVHTATREHGKALEYFTAAMELDPSYSEYHNERGSVHLAMGRHHEAIADYHEAIRLSAPYQEVWTNLGQCYREMGRPDDAVAAYSRALDLDPAAEVARVSRAQVLAALGRRDEARDDYEAALAVNPAQPPVLANLAVLLYRDGKVKDALRLLDRAVSLAPDHPAFRRNRAVALEELGRPNEAARDLAVFLTLVPGAPDRAAVEEKIAALQGLLALA